MVTKSELIEKVEILENLLSVAMDVQNKNEFLITADFDIVWENVKKIVDDNKPDFDEADDNDMFFGFREQVLDFEVGWKNGNFDLIDAYEIIAFLIIWINKKYIDL